MNKINFEAVANNITRILRALFDAEKPAVQQAVDGYIADAKTRITNLAAGAISGQFSYDFVIKRLKEEATIVKDIVLATGEMVGCDMEYIINQVVDVYQSTLNNAIQPEA